MDPSSMARGAGSAFLQVAAPAADDECRAGASGPL